MFNHTRVPAYYLVDKMGEVEKIQERPSQIIEFRKILLSKLMD